MFNTIEETNQKTEEITSKIGGLTLTELEKVIDFINSVLEEKETRQKLSKQRLANLQENIENLETNLVVNGKLKIKGKLLTFIPNDDSFKREIRSNQNSLKKTQRYLTILENNGKIGWARIVETRITQYGNAVKSHSSLWLNGKEYFVIFRANWDRKTLSNYNLQIELTSVDSPRLVCKIFSWFDLKNIEMVEINFDYNKPIGEYILDSILPSINDNTFFEIKPWLENNQETFSKEICSRLLTPFKYEKNLIGESAFTFLGYGEEFELKLSNFQNNNFLIFKALNNYAIFI